MAPNNRLSKAAFIIQKHLVLSYAATANRSTDNDGSEFKRESLEDDNLHLSKITITNIQCVYNIAVILVLL